MHELPDDSDLSSVSHGKVTRTRRIDYCTNLVLCRLQKKKQAARIKVTTDCALSDLWHLAYSTDLPLFQGYFFGLLLTSSS